MANTQFVNAGKCETNSGALRSYIRYKNDSGDWSGWSTKINPTTLEGATIEFKINVTLKQNCSIDLSLKKEIDFIMENEDRNDLFEIIDGPTDEFNKNYTEINCKEGESKEYIWTIRQIYDEKILGIYNFEARADFDCPDETLVLSCYSNSEIIVLNQTEKDTEPDTTTEEDNDSGDENTTDTPGFSLIVFLIALISIVYLKKRKIRK